MSLGWLLMLVAAAEGEHAQVTVTAERVLHDNQAERTIAEGTAHLETDGMAIDAERIVYEKTAGRVVAIGNVVARIAQQGTPTAIVAELVQLDLDGERVREVHVLDGRAWAKAGANVDKLLAAKTLEALDAAGPSTMLLSGNHFIRTDDGGWRLEQLELTPCDCDLRSPSWSIRTVEAVLNKDADRVSVKLPTFWIKKGEVLKVDVPFFGLPWLSLPLGDRATGLLFPKPGSTVLNGFSLEQPVFITAGRSADFTLTPGYFFGGSRRVLETPGRLEFPSTPGRPAWRNGDLDPVPSAFVQPFGIMGPRLLSEFRYVLSPRAQGRVTLGLLYDLREQRDPGNAGLALNRARGLRGEASLFHVQDFGDGFGMRVDLSTHSDGYYQRDITPDVIAREAGYLRSTAVLSHRGADHLLTLDAVLRQDLTAGYDLFGRDLFPRTSTAPRLGPNPIQRLPALTFTMPLRSLLGPLAFDVTADVVQQRPLRGLTGDEGALAWEGRTFDPFSGGELPVECLVERLYLARQPNQLAACPQTTRALKRGIGDSIWQAGERESRLRLNAMPKLWLAGAPGGLVSLSATAGWRQGLWWGHSSGSVVTRGYPLLAARAETEVARVFGGSLRHSMTPILEARAVPFVTATSTRPFDPALLGGPTVYDELDRSIGDNRARVQAIAELRNRLVDRGGREYLRLDVGQGFDLLSPKFPGPGGVFAPDTIDRSLINGPRLAETYARLAVSVWWFTVTGQGRLEPLWRKTADAPIAPRVTRASATFSADFPGGHGLNASYENVLDDGSNRARAPVDLLFGDPVPSLADSRAQLVTFGGRTKLGPVSLRYDVLFTSRRWSILEAGPLDDTLLRLRSGLDPSVSGAVPAVVPANDLLTFGQHAITASWTPACDCFRLDLSVAQRLTGAGSFGNWEFASFNFVVNKLGAIGSTP